MMEIIASDREAPLTKTNSDALYVSVVNHK